MPRQNQLPRLTDKERQDILASFNKTLGVNLDGTLSDCNWGIMWFNASDDLCFDFCTVASIKNGIYHVWWNKRDYYFCAETGLGSPLGHMRLVDFCPTSKWVTTYRSCEDLIKELKG